jgi:nucleoside-diphosphate-sugar epimerase
MILITGASGLVGEAIFNYFSKHYEVIGAAHSVIDPRFTALDLIKESEVESLFEKKAIRAIIHCATKIPARFKEEEDLKIYEANIKMGTNLLQNITSNVAFINISTCSLYDLETSAKLNEQSSIECNTFYQLSKKHIEDMLHVFYKDTSNLLNLRISSPYSLNRQSDTILYKFIESALEKNVIGLWGSGERRQAFTNVETFAISVKELYDKNINGDFNYLTTDSVSMLELAEKVKKYKKDLNIEIVDKPDPEEKCRTSFNLEKVLQFITVKDTLDSDISKIINERLAK